MSPDMSRLASLRTDGAPASGHLIRAREEFTSAETPEIVLAFDQSFAATGWTLMRFGTGPIDVMYAGTIKTASSFGGAMEDIDRAGQLYQQVKSMLQPNPRIMVIPFTEAYFETPLKGGHIRNPEVSLMAALAVRIAVREVTGRTAQPVSAKTWKKMATGNANLKDKRVAHNAVAGWPCVSGFDQATNESQRDAVMVGLGSQWKGA